VSARRFARGRGRSPGERAHARRSRARRTRARRSRPSPGGLAAAPTHPRGHRGVAAGRSPGGTGGPAADRIPHGCGGARVACPAIRRSVSVSSAWIPVHPRSIPGGRRSDRAPAGRCAIRIRRGTRRVPGDPQERERIERVDSGSRSIPGGRRSDRAPAGRCAIRIRRGTRRVPGDPRERERIERVDSSSSPLDPWRSTERPRSSRSLCDPGPEGHASRARRSAGA
jgi:hypothetical protein